MRTLGKIGDKIKLTGVETWNVNRHQISRNVLVHMSPVPGRGFAVSVLPITGEIRNYPAACSQQRRNGLMIAPSGNLSRTRGEKLGFDQKRSSLNATAKGILCSVIFNNSGPSLTKA
jgi:hypothetical protein